MLDLLFYSFKSIFANKTRSFLTILGIIVGITSMMMISVIGRAFTDTFEDVTEVLYKSDQMTVRIIPSDTNHTYVKDERGTLLLPESVYMDVRKVNEMLEKKEYGNAYVSTGSFITDDCKAVSNGRTGNILIWGTYANEGTTASQLMQRGRGITLADNRSGVATAVISDITERDLFGDSGDALGSTILVQAGNTVIPVVVVGIYKDPVYHIYNASFIYINHSYIEENYPNIIEDFYWERQDLVITLDDIEDKDLFKENAVAGLNGILNDEQWQVDAVTETENLNATKNIVDIILVIVFIIACISLFVGSIGIMSIMIITVTERTNEIGIRKSIGASNGMIMFQFLCESMTLSSLGTGLGILLGMIMSKVIAIYASDLLSNEFRMPITVNVTLPVEMLIGAVLSALIIGIVFGLYPAIRASKMEIVDSLRFE